jgi:class 3 adenylate cyclase
MGLVEQAVSAVRAAQAMQGLLPALNGIWQQAGVTVPMQMRIGINTGVLSVGSFGSEGRVTYTAIGLHTNIAARLEAHCPPGDILMSSTTWELVKNHIATEERGEVHCKGVREPVRVYAPLPSRPVPRPAVPTTDRLATTVREDGQRPGRAFQ